MKFSLNDKRCKALIFLFAIVSGLMAAGGAFFKMQPVYYCGMGAVVLCIIAIIAALCVSVKEDKALEKANEQEADNK